jgi:TRAP-type mannitol/chloroaromatic compound transport system permease large subunit
MAANDIDSPQPSVIPYVFIQLVGLTIIGLFPGLVTWLPKIIFG